MNLEKEYITIDDNELYYIDMLSTRNEIKEKVNIHQNFYYYSNAKKYILNAYSTISLIRTSFNVLKFIIGL